MLDQIRKNRIIQFLLVAGVLYTAWLLLYYLLIKTQTNWDYGLNYNIVELAQSFFSLFGIETTVAIESDHVVLYLDAGNYRGIWVGDECNGFKLFSIFSVFIIAFPGKIKHKLWFLPLGLIIIHLVNVLRIMALVMINNYYPRYLDFNHLYTFTIIVYAAIFVLWYIWAKKYSQHE
ncbi:MAG: exosortase family protein XrtF [Crocinitomix sp.]|jgi:exosortase family protein XrtF